MRSGIRSMWWKAVLPCGLLALGCGRGSPQTAPPAPPKVTVAHPEVRPLVDEDDYTGWLQASETVEVRARVRGHIKKVHFKDGDLVPRDKLLFELDPDPFLAQINAAIAQAKALEAQKSVAEKDVARYTELVKSGGATRQQLEKAQADAEAYDAQIAAKNAEVKRLELDLKYSRVTAPIEGRIGRAMLTEGNLVNAGGSDPLLATIVAVHPIHAYFNIDERSLQRYQKGRPAAASQPGAPPLRDQGVTFRFALDSDAGFPHEGLLDFADNRIDSATGAIPVRGVVKNLEGKFTPGSRIRVRIPVSEERKVVVVPDLAVLSDQDKKYLLVLGKDHVVLRRNIEPGRLLDDGARIVLPGRQEGEGVTADDWVITLGLQRARVNYPVEPLDPKGKPIAPREP